MLGGRRLCKVVSCGSAMFYSTPSDPLAYQIFDLEFYLPMLIHRLT